MHESKSVADLKRLVADKLFSVSSSALEHQLPARAMKLLQLDALSMTVRVDWGTPHGIRYYRLKLSEQL